VPSTEGRRGDVNTDLAAAARSRITAMKTKFGAFSSLVAASLAAVG
jgi:hypothetical protein